jgi:hypothetical protein
VRTERPAADGEPGSGRPGRPWPRPRRAGSHQAARRRRQEVAGLAAGAEGGPRRRAGGEVSELVAEQALKRQAAAGLQAGAQAASRAGSRHASGGGVAGRCAGGRLSGQPARKWASGRRPGRHVDGGGTGGQRTRRPGRRAAASPRRRPAPVIRPASAGSGRPRGVAPAAAGGVLGNRCPPTSYTVSQRLRIAVPRMSQCHTAGQVCPVRELAAPRFTGVSPAQVRPLWSPAVR